MSAAEFVLFIVALAAPQAILAEPRSAGTSFVRSKPARMEDPAQPAESLLDVSEHVTPTVGADHFESGGSDTGKRNEKSCEEPKARRNRHKMCFSSECGPPPTAFMVALAHGETQLESFASPQEVLYDSWWAEYVTRTEIDGKMTANTEHCNCTTCDEWNKYALKELSTPKQCKFPSHEWKLLFNEPAVETWLRPEITHEGYTYTNPNQVMSELGLQKQIAITAFSSGHSYRHIAAAQNTSVWTPKHAVTETWPVRAGHPFAVWQYVLICKVFNSHGMYINEAHFATSLKVATATTHKPSCTPNVDSCGQGTLGHHC